MKRFSIKIFVQGEVPFEQKELIPVFHQWIQQHKLEGLLIDVADYQHVHQGPGIMLIGHEADYAFDSRGGRVGFSYVRKQPLEGSLSEILAVGFAQLADAARKLEQEVSLNGLRFDFDTAHVTLLDRLNAPNRPEIYEGLKGDLQALAAQVYLTEAVRIENIEADPRKCLNVEIARV